MINIIKRGEREKKKNVGRRNLNKYVDSTEKREQGMELKNEKRKNTEDRKT